MHVVRADGRAAAESCRHDQGGPADGCLLSDGWVARVRDGELQVSGAGTADLWWRAVAVAAWSHLDLDVAGEPVAVSGLRPPGEDDDGG